MLAMYCVAIMATQPTSRALIANFSRSEYGLNQAQEKRDTKYHYQYRENTAGSTDQGDIAKAGRGQRGDGEIKRIDVVLYFRVAIDLADKDNCRYYKDKYQQIDNTENHVFIDTNKPRLLA